MAQAASAPLHSSDMPGLRLPNLPVLNWPFLIFSANSIPLMVMLRVCVPHPGRGRLAGPPPPRAAGAALESCKVPGALAFGFIQHAGHRPCSRFYKTRFDYATGRVAVVLKPHQHMPRASRVALWPRPVFPLRTRLTKRAFSSCSRANIRTDPGS
jgi:hypothetical protein